MTPDDLNKHLSQHIDVVMKTWFPNAKRRGSSYAMGDLDGGEGQSTGVYPGRGGVYLAKDKSTGESTNILKLVMRQVGNYHETQAEIKALLGITDVQTVAAAPKPETPKVAIKPLTGSWAMEYLTKTRGLSTDTLRKYGVRSHSRNSSYNTDFYAFKFVSPDGDYVMLKSVGVDKGEKGRKDIWSTAAYATLWGWPTVDDTADQITICEGEIDAMSLCDMGADMPVLSVPSGCSNMGWIENDYEALERFETIYLCFDNDEAGEKAANDVAKRLGITRCKRLRVPAPHNDLNDLLIAGDGMGPLYENAESYDPKTLKPVDGMAAELAEEIDRYQQENEHNPFLFPELRYRFRKGELTIVGGYPGHGKSQWLYQSCMHEMLNNDRRACIASFEIPSKSMLFNMLWMHNGHMPKEDSIQSDITQFQDRLWFIEGEKAANDVAKRLGITRCKRLRVPAPHNDLNDLLIAGDGMGPLYENAESYDPKTLKPVDGMAAELAEEIDRYQQENEHNPFLFPELRYRFRKGELTIVGGYPGHGKSQWLYQSCMHEMLNNDRRACIASFEIPSKSMLFNMLWMHNGHMPKEDSIQSDITQFQDRLWFIEGVEGGTNSWASLHQDFLYAHRRYGVDLFVIDALMHIAAKDDWGGQERIAKEAAKFAIDNDVTILLVCHADAKKAGSGQVPELEDVLGGQGIGAAAHAAVMIWRNKAKEKAIEAGEDVSDEMPDGRMYVPKQRANGITIYRDLWFDKSRRTFSLEPKPNLGVDLPF